MSERLLGQRFNHRHAAGVTRFQVDRAHRDAGFFACVAVRGVEGSHHFIGGIQIFSSEDIRLALDEEAEDEGLTYAAEGESARHPRERW